MIDTIILRLHDIEKYSQLIKCLELYNNNGYTTETAKVPIKELSPLRRKGRSDNEIIEILKEKRSGDFLLKTQVGKQMNASNHYAFTYFINYTKNYVEFNFSIPKYKYGSNVLMFQEHFCDRDFKYHNSWQLDYCFGRSFTLLDKFLRNFIKNEFILCKVDLKDIEINRIDVCFNQIFASKEDALLYLNYQKKLKKKYSRDESGVMRDYTTSLMYITKRYSAKIYHKGTEYEKNDLKQHEAINDEKGYQYFKIKEFQKFADRILRYELTIRNTYLNYLHKQEIFRRGCSIYRTAFSDYQNVESILQYNDRISKKAGTLNGDQKKIYLFNNPYKKVSKESRHNYKYVQNLITKRTYFMMETDLESAVYNRTTVTYPCITARFSEELFKHCLNRLLEFINEFKIKELPDEEKLKQSIDNYNAKTISQLPKADMLRFYAQLQQHGSFKDVQKFCSYSRATLYRYKARFKKIGITETSIKPVTEAKIPEASIDFKTYHTYLMYDYDLLRGINVL